MFFLHFIKTFSIYIFLAAGLLLSGCNKDSSTSPKNSVLPLFSDDALMNEILGHIRSYYISAPVPEKMRDGAINGLLSSLDPYCMYLSPEAYEHLQQSSIGEFGGLGLEILFQEGTLKIITPLDDSPAAKAGLVPGDYITFVNNLPVASLTYTALLKILHGQPNTSVQLTIQRGDAAPFTLNLNREIIHINPIKYYIHNHVAYIRLSYFNEKTKQKLIEAVEAIKKTTNQNQLQGVILDLRNNPGGVFDQAIEIANCFLSDGIITSVLNKDPQLNKTYTATGPDLFLKTPLIVLINNGTASCAEIVAAALQDNKRALIMGQKSVGKGSIQSVIPLSHKDALKLTTAVFKSPLGKTITDNGIIPDISVSCPPSFACLSAPPYNHKKQDDLLTQAYDLLKGLSLLKRS